MNLKMSVIAAAMVFPSVCFAETAIEDFCRQKGEGNATQCSCASKVIYSSLNPTAIKVAELAYSNDITAANRELNKLGLSDMLNIQANIKVAFYDAATSCKTRVRIRLD
jgi:hypothetical protein